MKKAMRSIDKQLYYILRFQDEFFEDMIDFFYLTPVKGIGWVLNEISWKMGTILSKWMFNIENKHKLIHIVPGNIDEIDSLDKGESKE